MKQKIKIALDAHDTSYIQNYRLEVFRGVIRYAREHTDWQLIFNIHSFSLTHQFEKYEDLPSLDVDGLIFLDWDPNVIERIKNLNIPAVSITNVPEDANISCVLSNDFEVGQLASRHFIEKGFRNFAYCGSNANIWSQERLIGYERELAEHDFTPSRFFYEISIYENLAQNHESADQIVQWLKELPKPVAVFCENDTRALHVLEACLESGIKVPHEVAILGVDNNQVICDSMKPYISSVEQNTDRVGFEAAAMLDKNIRSGNNEARRIVVPPKGIFSRMSSDVLAVDDPALERGLMFIREHFQESIGVCDVAKAAGLSRSSLEQKFRKRMKTTVNHEIKNHRIGKVKTLLVDTGLSLEEIAQNCGFRRATYLSNIFLKETGLTPGNWRRKYRVE